MVGLAVLVAVLGVDRLARRFQVLGIDVAGRDHLGPGLFEKALHVVAALPAGADAGHRDPIAGRDGAIAAEGGGWHDRRESRDPARYGLQKSTPLHILILSGLTTHDT